MESMLTSWPSENANGRNAIFQQLFKKECFSEINGKHCINIASGKAWYVWIVEAMDRRSNGS